MLFCNFQKCIANFEFKIAFKVSPSKKKALHEKTAHLPLLKDTELRTKRKSRPQKSFFHEDRRDKNHPKSDHRLDSLLIIQEFLQNKSTRRFDFFGLIDQ